MAAFNSERVLSVHHWNDTLFSFKTTRDPALRFHNGHFVMIGLEVNGKPLLRAYSIASANYEENLEFLSIKVQDGPLTFGLQHLKEGDTILVSRKPVGTLVADDLKPGKNLYLFGTGTGLAPFMSIIKDPDIYERFDKVVLMHGVRYVSELAYADYIENELPNNEFFGDIVRGPVALRHGRHPFHDFSVVFLQLGLLSENCKFHLLIAAAASSRRSEILGQPLAGLGLLPGVLLVSSHRSTGLSHAHLVVCQLRAALLLHL